ncbi:MAG: protein kinase, partial [Planctomycetota bacterium]
MTTLPPDASPTDLPSPRGDDNDEAVAPPTSEQTLFVVGGPGESPPATGSADNDVAPPTDANTLLSLTRDAAIDASDLSAAFRNESHDPDTRLRRTRDALQGDGFDRYDIHREVGRGGMGVVLRAHDRRTRRDVAIKRMLDPVRGASAEMRFIQECQITAQLEHPGIVPVHDLGLDDRGRVFLSMKLVNGRSLQQRLTGALAVVRDAGSLEAAFPLAERLAVFRKVCDAVAFAHSRGTIHRDLKPDNVMIGAFGEVLVMDWGLARIIGSGETHREQLVLSDRHDGSDGDSEARTLDGAVAGTPAYMSPEQARGDISLLDQRTDVYALGAILYEMLTLTPPFRGRTSWEILSSVRSGKLEPAIERVRQEFGEAMTRPPRELEAVILRAMAFEREQRYADVPALAADIDAFLAGRAVGAADYSPLQLLAKWAARHRAPVITAAAAAVLLAAVAVVFVVNLRSAYETAVIERDRADHEATRASEQAARATDQASLAERRREEADSERAAADRQRIEALRALDAAIAFRASADDDTLRRIAWLSAGQSVRTRATAMTLTAPLFTHERMMTGQTEMRRIELTADGRSAVVVLNERHTLAVIDLDTFARRDLRLELDDNEAVLLALPDPAPGSDRAAIAVVRDSMKLTRPRPDDSRVVICSLTDGHQIRALPPAASYCSGLAFSPDGSLLGSCTQTAIRVVHTDTGEPVWQAAATGSSANLWFDPTGRIAAVCTGKQIEFRETASWGLLGAPVEGLRAFFYQPNPIALISIGSGS